MSSRLPDRKDRVSWAMRLQRLCASVIDQDSVKDYRQRDQILDPLYDLSAEVLPRIQNCRVGFSLTLQKVLRLSAFLMTPQKASDPFEEMLGASIETYARVKFIAYHAVLFEVGDTPFVYTDWRMELTRYSGALVFHNRGRQRMIMHLPAFLSAYGLREEADE